MDCVLCGRGYWKRRPLDLSVGNSAGGGGQRGGESARAGVPAFLLGGGSKECSGSETDGATRSGSTSLGDGCDTTASVNGTAKPLFEARHMIGVEMLLGTGPQTQDDHDEDEDDDTDSQWSVE